MILKFLELLKLRIVIGNLISVGSGFLIASKHYFNINLILLTLISSFFIISSACMLNNVIDRKLDSFMKRTKYRFLVIYSSMYKFVIYLSILFGLIGFFICSYFINLLCVFLFFIGFLIYVIFYSLFSKRKSIYSTIIGSISGAIPPVVGYCSVSNHFDLCALNLFIAFSLWQIPHSYSICIMYLDDYKHANLPVFPIVKGLLKTQNHIICCIFLYVISILILGQYSFSGYKYLISLFVLCLIWLFYSFQSFLLFNRITWAKKIFQWSIINIFMLNIVLLVNYIFE